MMPHISEGFRTAGVAGTCDGRRDAGPRRRSRGSLPVCPFHARSNVRGRFPVTPHPPGLGLGDGEVAAGVGVGRSVTVTVTDTDEGLAGIPVGVSMGTLYITVPVWPAMSMPQVVTVASEAPLMMSCEPVSVTVIGL